MKHRTRCPWPRLVGSVLALALAQRAGAQQFPLDSAVTLQVLPANNAECSAGRKTLRESAAASALLSAVLPKAIDLGLASLSSALRAASGEDEKTRVFKAATTANAYRYSRQTGDRAWSPANGCLLLLSTRNVGAGPVLRALIPINISKDQTAMAFELPELEYRARLAPGRKVEQMTMAIIVYNGAGQEVAQGLLPGPFVPAPDKYQAGNGSAPTTGWISLPPLSEAVKTAVARYDSLCDTRSAAATAYVEGKVAEINAGKGSAALKKRRIAEIRAQVGVDADSPCGKTIPSGVFADPGLGWSQAREDALPELGKSLLNQEPITFQVVVTETRDVSKFLLAMSEALKGDQPQIRDALVGILDPAARRKLEDEHDAAEQTRRKNRIDATSAYEQDLAAFDEKARLYRKAMADLSLATTRAVAAKARADADPGNAELASAAEAAREKLESAQSARAAALADALTAKQLALEAALAADIDVASTHPLRRFPG